MWKRLLIMWLLFNRVEQLNCVKQFFLVQTIKYLIWTNTKNLKNGSFYKKVKISYEATNNSKFSNSKFDTDDVQLSFHIFDLILTNFILIVHICIFHKRWSLILGCVFPVSIHKSMPWNVLTIASFKKHFDWSSP